MIGLGPVPRHCHLFDNCGELTINGQVHLRARDYDPKSGTFTTRDPMDGVDGTTVVADPYHYGANDPLNQTDPLGLRNSDHNMNIRLGDTGPYRPVVVQVLSAMEQFLQRLQANWDGLGRDCSGRNDRGCREDWVRKSAREIGGYEPGSFYWNDHVLDEPPAATRIMGRSGWKVELTDNDNNPARHFIGWLAAGYFHGGDAEAMLRIAEAPSRRGPSGQDIRNGMIAIHIGQDLWTASLFNHQGKEFSVTDAIARIRSEAADPSNAGVEVPVPEATETPWECYIPLAPC